jgi:acetyl esterase
MPVVEELDAQILPLARGPVGGPVTREIANITDEVVEGIPIRIYRGDSQPTGMIVYFHGGGFCIGSIGLMDNVARELTHATDAVVISVEYRLAPEHPYPAGLDDCETITRWAFANATRFGVARNQIAVAGESAGGNLSTAVALRLRGDPDHALAAQVLMYPGLDNNASTHRSRSEFDGLVLTKKARDMYWSAYTGGRDLGSDPFVAPLQSDDLSGLPPALLILGGCDLLRDEGRLYATRLREAGVAAEDVCYAGQPHGFINFMFPAAHEAFDRIGTWVRAQFGNV